MWDSPSLLSPRRKTSPHPYERPLGSAFPPFGAGLLQPVIPADSCDYVTEYWYDGLERKCSGWRVRWQQPHCLFSIMSALS